MKKIIVLAFGLVVCGSVVKAEVDASEIKRFEELLQCDILLSKSELEKKMGAEAEYVAKMEKMLRDTPDRLWDRSTDEIYFEDLPNAQKRLADYQLMVKILASEPALATLYSELRDKKIQMKDDQARSQETARKARDQKQQEELKKILIAQKAALEKVAEKNQK